MIFDRFPREIGLHRKIIYNQKQFRDYITKNNGITDCYTSAYSTDFLIDKIFFDFDGKNSFDETKTLYQFLTKEKKFTVIPVISGMKGFHLYQLVKPDYYSKQELTIASYSLVYEVFDKIKALDTHVLGDIRRLVRIPNTLRPPENKNWCSYLPQYFDELSEWEVFEYQKAPHNFNYKINTIPNLRSLMKKEITFSSIDEIKDEKPVKVINHNILNYIRPCLIKPLEMPNAPHTIRLAVTIDLIHAGLSDYEIFGLYKELGWNDFEPETTLHYIKAIRNKGYKPYSCKKLRLLGLCHYECLKKKEVIV